MTSIEEYRAKPRKRSQKMPEVVQRAVELIKSEERQALLKGLEQKDPAVAEMLRVAAVAYDNAAKLVLLAFDEVTKRPTL